MEIKSLQPIQKEIVREIVKILKDYKVYSGVTELLLSWGTSLSEEKVLELLKAWNGEYSKLILQTDKT